MHYEVEESPPTWSSNCVLTGTQGLPRERLCGTPPGICVVATAMSVAVHAPFDVSS